MWQLDAQDKNGIYNMGTGSERSFKDLVLATFKAMETEASIEYIDMPISIRHQYQYFTKANMDKFSKLLPSFKFSTLEQAVSDYILSYLNKGCSYSD